MILPYDLNNVYGSNINNVYNASVYNAVDTRNISNCYSILANTNKINEYWKCAYCDGLNKTTTLKCKNCNAPRRNLNE